MSVLALTALQDRSEINLCTYPTCHMLPWECGLKPGRLFAKSPTQGWLMICYQAKLVERRLVASWNRPSRLFPFRWQFCLNAKERRKKTRCNRETWMRGLTFGPERFASKTSKGVGFVCVHNTYVCQWFHPIMHLQSSSTLDCLHIHKQLAPVSLFC